MYAEETMIFDTKRQAQRVARGLHNGSILCRLAGREVTAIVPPAMSAETVRDLMRRLLDA